MDEFAFIEKLRKRVPRSKHVLKGIGDDAAVLKGVGRGSLVIATDMLVEGVDFVLGKLSPEKIGRKALAVNLSDLAAMGAEPFVFVLSVGKPEYITVKWLDRFYDGMLKLAEECEIGCVGGDFSRSKEFSASVTVLGRAVDPVLRSGAKSGDYVGVTGVLGGSIRRHHYSFLPRLREGKFLAGAGRVNSMIDISDGLIQDLEHILHASGKTAELNLDLIPVSRDALALTSGRGAAALERALTDGEDFELLFTISAEGKTRIENGWKKRFPEVPLSWIGKISSGAPTVRYFSGGKRIALTHLRKKGYRHF